MAYPNGEWWKSVPCHFIWQLEDGTDKDYYTLKNSLESKLAQAEYGTVATLLLLRSYLPMSSFKDVPKSSTNYEAINVLNRTDVSISRISDDTQKRAHAIVSLANRLWTIDKIATSKEEDRKLYMDKLSEVWEPSKTRSKDLCAHLDAIAGFALMRLGPGKRDEAEKKYRQALKIFPNNPMWLYYLGELVGRQARKMAQGSAASDPKMIEERELYEQSLDVDPTQEVVRCALAQVMFRLGEEEEAEREFLKLKNTTSKIIIEKGRFYRKLRKFDKALEILKKGVQLPFPRGELFMQIALVYDGKAAVDHNWEAKKRFYRKEIEYINQCLDAEPTHFVATLSKAKAYSKMRENEKAERLFRSLLENKELFLLNKLEGKIELAKFLTIRNRKRMPQEAAKLYREVLEEAVEKCAVAGPDGRLTFLEAKGLVNIAKQKLFEFHGADSAKAKEIVDLLRDVTL